MSSDFTKLPIDIQERMKELTVTYTTKKMAFDSINQANVVNLTLYNLIDLAHKQNIAVVELNAAMNDVQAHHQLCVQMLSEITNEN